MHRETERKNRRRKRSKKEKKERKKEGLPGEEQRVNQR